MKIPRKAAIGAIAGKDSPKANTVKTSPLRRGDHKKLHLDEMVPNEDTMNSDEDNTARVDLDIPDTHGLISKQQVPESVAHRKPNLLSQSTSQRALGAQVG